MKTFIALFGALLLSSFVQAAPFEKGNPKIGKALHDKSCINCHIGMFGGDGGHGRPGGNGGAVFSSGSVAISSSSITGSRAGTGGGDG
mgnify:CR=1 FL=1